MNIIALHGAHGIRDTFCLVFQHFSIFNNIQKYGTTIA